MATQPVTNSAKGGGGDPVATLPVLSRQPILNAHSESFAYRLRFWDGNEENVGQRGFLESRMILDSSLLYGLERMARGMPAFIPAPAALLTPQWAQLLPARFAILELEAGAEVSDALLATCRQLKALGFRLALDGFTGQKTPLLPLADFVRIDSLRFAAADRGRLLGSAGQFGAGRIALNVETQGQFRTLQGEGFEFFEGYFFCHPEPIAEQKIPADRIIHLEILELLQNEPFDLHRLAQLVSCDASLTYRLLRLVNSPMCAIRKEVTSIEEAILFVGQELFRRVTALAVATDFNRDQPAEILRMAFERAGFCESSAPLLRQREAEQYLIGMASLFPAMLRIRPDELVKMLPLRSSVQLALEGKDVPEGALLRWVAAHEHGDWGECSALARSMGVSPEELMQRFAGASMWAESALGSVM